MCDYHEIGTTCNTQMMDMDVNNYYVTLGCDWKTLIGGYLSLNYHPQKYEKHQCQWEETTIPYIKCLLQPNIDRVDTIFGTFHEEDNKQCRAHA